MNPRPSSGFRLVLQRVGTDPHPGYEGVVHLPDRDVPVGVTFEPQSGAPRVALDGPAELTKSVSALVRAATKGLEGAALPRKIVRWRG